MAFDATSQAAAPGKVSTTVSMAAAEGPEWGSGLFGE
jgi:hypothetical protein